MNLDRQRRGASLKYVTNLHRRTKGQVGDINSGTVAAEGAAAPAGALAVEVIVVVVVAVVAVALA